MRGRSRRTLDILLAPATDAYRRLACGRLAERAVSAPYTKAPGRRVRARRAALRRGLRGGAARRHWPGPRSLRPGGAGERGVALDSLDLRGGVRPAIGVDLDWAHEPLVLYDVDEDRPVASIVDDQLSSTPAPRSSSSRIAFASASTCRSRSCSRATARPWQGSPTPRPVRRKSATFGSAPTCASPADTGAPSRWRRGRACICPRAAATTTRATASCASPRT